MWAELEWATYTKIADQMSHYPSWSLRELGTWPMASLHNVNKQLSFFKNVDNQLSLFKKVNKQLPLFKMLTISCHFLKNVNKQLLNLGWT